MSDEPEARMWDDERGAGYDVRSQGVFYESAFASSEHLDRAPLLAEEQYTEEPLAPARVSEHCHWESRSEPPSAVPQLLAALVLCGIFMVCELIGGYLAGSLSVMSDAVHMLSDCGGFALALLAFRCARRPPGERMSYGYKRAEVLGAMVSVLLIWILTAIFVYLAALRLHTNDYDINVNAMTVVSGCGVLFNVVLAAVLHCGSDIAHHHTHGGAACPSHGHAHAHAHSPPPKLRFNLFRRKDKQTNGAIVNGDYSLRELSTESSNPEGPSRNINLRAALIHVIGDLIQSCGVLLASIIIQFYPEAKFVDPLCTFVFSVIVLASSARVVRDALAMLMQAVPRAFRYRECLAALRGVPGVRHVHSLHAWALSTHVTVLTAHVAIDEIAEHEAVLAACKLLARSEFNVQSATFQVERRSEDMAACRVCCAQPAMRA